MAPISADEILIHGGLKFNSYFNNGFILNTTTNQLTELPEAGFTIYAPNNQS